MVLIPLNSGLVFTYTAARKALLNLVLFPLNSGLVFTLKMRKTTVMALCLNPFEFRAGIYLIIKDATRIENAS